MNRRITRGPQSCGPRAVSAGLLLVALIAAGCDRSDAPRLTLQDTLRPQALIQRGTPRQRLILRRILAASAAQPIQVVRFGAPPAKRGTGTWMYFLVRRTDDASSTKAKWAAMLAGRRFADAAVRRGLPRIRGITVRTAGLSNEDGRELIVRLIAAREPPRPLTKERLDLLVHRARALGIEVRRIVGVQLFGSSPEAVEITGRVAKPSSYLQILSETASSPPVVRGIYYRLENAVGRPVIRFGIAEGIARSDRLVAWVHPDLLSGE